MPTSQQLGALCKCRPALNRECSIKLDNFAGTSQNFLDYVIRSFNASSGRIEKSPWGWIFDGTALYAISNFLVPPRNWIAVNAVNNPT